MTYKFMVRGAVYGDAPPGGVTWGIVGADGAVGYATGSSPTTWTGYRSPGDAGGNDHTDLGYGEDGSGGNRWVRTTSNNNYELAYSDDITNSSGWNNVNITGRRYNVKWANGKWIAVGGILDPGADILTSSNGADWGSVSISGLTSLSTTNITSLATDGTTNWIFGQDDRVYATVDHGVSWFLLKDFNDNSTIHEAAYSNNKWYVVRTSVGGGAIEKVGVAASASSGSWTDSLDLDLGSNTRAMFASVSTGSASESTVCVVNSNDVARSVDSGATFTKLTNVLPHGSARSITSDGDGNWVASHDGGKISFSNDDGETWSDGTASGNVTFGSGTEDIDAVAVDKVLPL